MKPQRAQMTLRLWGGDPEADLIEKKHANGMPLIAFRLPMRVKKTRPWVIVRHPLWRPDQATGPLADFREELAAEAKVIAWDTFNLTRRPGRTRQWMTHQGRTPRSSRKRRATATAAG